MDNFVNGYGLTWNVAERVQSYTHPLWMFSLSVIYIFTREPFYSTLLLSIATSLITVCVLSIWLLRTTLAATVGVLALTLSKAFIDYSTSGLENPLTHLLLVLFLLVYLRNEPSPKKLFLMTLLASLGMTNRLDTLLLFLPALVFSLIEVRSVRGVWMMLLGGMPFILWELFSLLYYGFPVPNTGPAKLNIGLTSRADLLRQGGFYLLNSLRWDPLTLVLTAVGVAVALVSRECRRLPVSLGVVLYVLYVVWIGGGFMSGRFLAAPFLFSVVLLADSPGISRPVVSLALLVTVVGLGLGSPRSPVLTGLNAEVGLGPESWVDPNRITDERVNYYQSTGFLSGIGESDPVRHDWAQEGREARANGPAVVQKGSVGFFGYYAGPEVHVVDLLALNDPLLARLPPSDQRSGLGHLGRIPPDGYVETLETGENRITNPDLAAYYDKLSIIVRGDLLANQRLVEIWRFNLGVYDHLRDAYAYFSGETFTLSLQVVNPTERPYAYAYVWNNEAAEAFLLDSNSSLGDAYLVDWIVTLEGAHFNGPHEQQTSFGNPLSDTEPLNVGVFFSESADLTSYDIYERRFWFRIEDDDSLSVILPPTEWHNGQAPDGAWVAEDIDRVINDAH